MVITRYPLQQNNGNSPLPFFGGNYPIVLLNNIINYCICILNGLPGEHFFMIVYVIQN